MDDDILKSFEKYNEGRNLLDLELDTQRLKRLRSKVAMQTRSQYKKQRRNIEPIENATTAALTGPLGKRILSAAADIQTNCWKSRYLSYLSRNIIIDFSNSAQLDLVGVTLAQVQKYIAKVEVESRDIEALKNCTKKASNHMEAKASLREAEAYQYSNLSERAIKTIYVHTLDQIVNKATLFTTSTQKRLSEMSFIVKFWSPIIEQYFDTKEYCIQWGDTKSACLALSNLNFKLDLRIIIADIQMEEFDVTTGEFASHSTTISSKMNKDFLKSVLATKGHLNAVLEKMLYIPPNQINKVKMPLIQIMGLSCFVYTMHIVDKKVYAIQLITSFNYPSTLREVKTGAITKLIDGFAVVEEAVANIKEMITEYSKTPTRALANLKTDKKKGKGIKSTDIKAYISKVVSGEDLDNDDNGEFDDSDDSDGSNV